MVRHYNVREQTEEICLAAVKQSGCALKFVKEHGAKFLYLVKKLLSLICQDSLGANEDWNVVNEMASNHFSGSGIA